MIAAKPRLRFATEPRLIVSKPKSVVELPARDIAIDILKEWPHD
jgi:hypothetical protein